MFWSTSACRGCSGTRQLSPAFGVTTGVAARSFDVPAGRVRPLAPGECHQDQATGRRSLGGGGPESGSRSGFILLTSPRGVPRNAFRGP